MKRTLASFLALLSLYLAAPAFADRPHVDYTTVTKNANTTDANTDAVIWTPASGKRIILMGAAFSADATDTLFMEVSTTTIIPVQYLGANVPDVLSGGGRPIWEGATDQALTYTTTTSANTSIFLWGYEE